MPQERNLVLMRLNVASRNPLPHSVSQPEKAGSVRQFALDSDVSSGFYFGPECGCSDQKVHENSVPLLMIIDRDLAFVPGYKRPGPNKDALLMFRLHDCIATLREFLAESETPEFSLQLCEELWSSIAKYASHVMDKPYQNKGKTATEVFANQLEVLSRLEKFVLRKLESTRGETRMQQVALANVLYLMEESKLETAKQFPHLSGFPDMCSTLERYPEYHLFCARMSFVVFAHQVPEEQHGKTQIYQEGFFLSEAEAKQYNKY